MTILKYVNTLQTKKGLRGVSQSESTKFHFFAIFCRYTKDKIAKFHRKKLPKFCGNHEISQIKIKNNNILFIATKKFFL